jgi:hypothetical protein
MTLPDQITVNREALSDCLMAISAAWTDMSEWLQFASHVRETHPHNMSYVPTAGAIHATKERRATLGTRKNRLQMSSGEIVTLTVAIRQADKTQCMYIGDSRWNGDGREKVFVSDLIETAGGSACFLKSVLVDNDEWPENLSDLQVLAEVA